MKITACYIVKNEADNLARSLSSIGKQVDDVVVVDTGSSDGTKEIALSHGAKLYEFSWRNDFAAARNFALDQVQADWVVFLDADEYFSQETAENLRRVIEQSDREGQNLLIVPLRNIDVESGKVLLDSHVPRIFRALPNFRYEGRIHEELRDRGQAVEGVGVVSREELLLVHTGYSQSLSKAKAQRNVGILLGELERGGNPGSLYMYLAEAYDGMEDSANAMKYARLDVAQGRRNVVYASRSWHILLRQLSRDSADFWERQEVAAQAVRDFPELPEFHAEYAECLAFVLDFPGAVREAEAAVRAFYECRFGLEPVMFDESMLAVLERRYEDWKRIDARSREIRVTSCLIVRDGEEDMESWLGNTAVFSDERIVVDTGSRDRTREIARFAGCSVHDFQWDHDFSRARNEALSHATGDWVSVLDADEAFEHPEQVKPFLAWLEDQHPEIEAVILPLINIDADDGNREISRNMVLRLFRNHRGLHYEGNVHEALCRKDGSSPCIFQERQRLRFHHWGYSSGRMLAKARRNLELLQEDIARCGEGPQHYRYLADCYSTMGEWDEVLSYARRAIDSPMQSVVPDSRMQHLLLIAMRKLDRSFAEQEAVAREMCERFPEKPEFPGILGVLLAEQGKDGEACPFLEASLHLAEKAASTGLPNDFADEQGIACAWLARIYANAGRKEESEELLKYAMDISPREDDVLNAARDIKHSLSAESFFRWLQPWLFPNRETAVFLSRWAERNGHVDLLAYWRERMLSEYGHSLPRAELYEAATMGRTGELEERIASGMERNLHFLVMSLFQMEQERNAGWQDLARQCCNLLPATMRDAWMAYLGKQEEFTFEGFRALWPVARTVGDESQIEKFALLSFSIEGDTWRRTARDLMEDEAWEVAFSLYGRISEDSPQADGEFWHDVGVCLWHMGETAATECFARARALGCEAEDMAAYEAWMKEDGLL